MALNLATLTAGIKAALEDGGADPDSPFTLSLAQGIASAVIEEIQANATVTVATTCGAGAGTGTGTVA